MRQTAGGASSVTLGARARTHSATPTRQQQQQKRAALALSQLTYCPSTCTLAPTPGPAPSIAVCGGAVPSHVLIRARPASQPTGGGAERQKGNVSCQVLHPGRVTTANPSRPCTTDFLKLVLKCKLVLNKCKLVLKRKRRPARWCLTWRSVGKRRATHEPASGCVGHGGRTCRGLLCRVVVHWHRACRGRPQQHHLVRPRGTAPRSLAQLFPPTSHPYLVQPRGTAPWAPALLSPPAPAR